MVMLTEGNGTGGLLRVRNLISADITHAQAGTGTTAPATTDTGLESAVAATLETTTNTTGTSPNSITIEHVIPLADANGEDLTEWETRVNSNGDSLNRTVTAAITKRETQQITRFTTFEITPD